MAGLHYQTELNFGQVPHSSEKWGWFLLLGLILMLLGGAAIWFDVFTTFITVGLLGGLLIIGGFAVLAHAALSRRWSGFFLNFLLGLLYVVLGFLLMNNPWTGALSLTILMAAFFVVSGLFRSIAAAIIRFEHWGWFLASGLVTFILGMLIWAQWPLSGLFILGLFVGIDLLMVGWSLVVLALAARSPRHFHPI